MPHVRRRRSLCRSLAHVITAFAIALPAVTAHASAQRTFVSPNGADANTASNCALTAPCRSFGAAITVTNAGGEIIVLDSAGYGAVTIAKSVSIISPPGIYAGVSVLSGEGITINTAGVEVTLKGLTVNGQGGTVGIHFSQGSRLDIDGCTVSNMGAQGILVDGAGTISIANTAVVGNTAIGIEVDAAAVVTITDSTVESNGSHGVAAEGGASMTIAGSTITKNAQKGVFVQGVAAGTRMAMTSSVVSDQSSGAGLYAEALTAGDVVRLDVTNTTLARNATGVQVNSIASANAKAGVVNNQIVENPVAGILAQGSGSSVIRASRNAVFRNGVGLSTTGGGVIYSPMTNYVRDNSTDASAGTPAADSLL
jgi:hypothetical protein